jgi:hypothetical protein
MRIAYRHTLRDLHMRGQRAPHVRVTSEHLPQVVDDKRWLAQLGGRPRSVRSLMSLI